MGYVRRAFLAASDSTRNEEWFYDTGATSHTCNCEKSFELFVPNLDLLWVGSSACIPSYGTDDVCFRTLVNNNTYVIMLKDATSAPDIMLSLILKCRSSRVEFQVILDNDTTDSSREITKIVQKATARFAILCIKN